MTLPALIPVSTSITKVNQMKIIRNTVNPSVKDKGAKLIRTGSRWNKTMLREAVYQEVGLDLRLEGISNQIDFKVIQFVYQCRFSRIKINNNILNSLNCKAKMVLKICNKYVLFTVGLLKISK